MRKTLSILLSILSLTLMAQVPQGVGYQGVATDANGVELVNDSISIRASVLSGSANGTVEWEEIHATSTDTFGLFTLTIGQGTNTTNGTQTSFADISWGTNTHFLKIEMDVTGGSTYSYMGTNQMMSVPYALFAESANINYDSISNLLSNDSTFITNVGGGMGGGGCDFKYPDGLDGEVINLRFSQQSSYTVPTGKTLYVTNFFGDAQSCYMSIDFNNVNGSPHIFSGLSNYNNYQGKNIPSLLLPIIVGEGEKLFGGGGNASCNGLLVDKGVLPITWTLGWGTYTVPSGKKLYVLNSNDNGNGQNSYFYIDDGNGNQIIHKGYANWDETKSFSIPLVFDENTVLSGNPTFNGYLVDENYFANCGGGGSSSTTINYDSLANIISMDSTFITTVGGGMGGGCNIDPFLPEGFIGTEYVANTTPYTVPTGKTFYLHTAQNNLTINGIDDVVDSDHFFPIPIKENSTIDWSGGTVTLNGYIIDEGYEVINYLGGNTNYTVPVGNYLYILNSRDFLSVNSNVIMTTNVQMGGSNTQPPYILQPGDIVSSVKGFNGLLIPVDDCNSGGSSSTSSLDSTAIANMIANSGGSGGCHFLYPEGHDGNAVTEGIDSYGNTYTVPAEKRLYVLGWRQGQATIDGSILSIPDGRPLILNAGQILASENGSSTFNGYLVDEKIELTAVTEGIDSYGNTYTVPAGKRLYVLGWNQGLATIDGSILSIPDSKPLILNAGQILATENGYSTFNGYLADENYFANCGGGGSSSNSNSNTSGPNQTVGIGSITDLDDFDKEYDMFNAQLSGDFNWDKTNIHYDQLNNIYIIGAYSTNYNNSIAGTSLHYTPNVGYETFFIAKYDSSGNMQYVISEPIPSASSNNYYYRSSMVDDYGNIFVGGRTWDSSGDYQAFIRKYNTSNLSFVSEQLSASPTGDWKNQVNDIVSDGSGGAYFVGSYEDAITFGSQTLASDAASSQQGFVAHWDNTGIISWAETIGNIALSASQDYASSITVDQNNNIFVAGRLSADYTQTNLPYKTFIKKYNTSGQLITTVESDFMSYNIPLENGVKVNVDNNGNVYLFTSHNVTTEDPNYVFNSFSLTPIISNSQILYKMDNNLSVLDAINFGTGTVLVNQIIALSNNDIILRTMNQVSYLINNSIYEQDVIQTGNLTHLDSNNDFVKFHTLGSTIGDTYSSSITANTNTIYTLYKRSGPVTNNGTTHPSGYYVVKEQY